MELVQQLIADYGYIAIFDVGSRDCWTADSR